MDVFQFPPMDRPNNQVPARAVCSECGVAFETRHNAAAVEMICDSCYSAQFEPVRIHHWQRIPHRLRRAR